jgi:hypothetical protein
MPVKLFTIFIDGNCEIAVACRQLLTLEEGSDDQEASSLEDSIHALLLLILLYLFLQNWQTKPFLLTG